MTDFSDKLKELVERGLIDSNCTSVRTNIVIYDAPPGITKKKLDSAQWSEELFNYVLAQDDDPYALPYGAVYYNDGFLYPLYGARNMAELEDMKRNPDRYSNSLIKHLKK
jgi:hypothetical protein